MVERTVQASDFARPVHIVLFTLQAVYTYRFDHNNPDSLTTLNLTTNFLNLAPLEELFLLNENLGIWTDTKVHFQKIVF